MPLRKEISDKVRWLARYPDNKAKWFKRYVINGLKFRTKDSKATRKTQNSGVCVVTEGGAIYFGVLIDIIELNYSNKSNLNSNSNVEYYKSNANPHIYFFKAK